MEKRISNSMTSIALKVYITKRCGEERMRKYDKYRNKIASIEEIGVLNEDVCIGNHNTMICNIIPILERYECSKQKRIEWQCR